MNEHEINFRDILIEEYNVRKQKNCKYSKRAFGRDMGVSSSFNTLLLNGKKGLSEDRALEIGKNLKFPQAKLVEFLNAVRFANLKDKEFGKEFLQKQDDFQALDTDVKEIAELHFQNISLWYTGLVLVLIESRKGDISVAEISDRIGIKEEDISQLIINLLRTGILEVVQGRLRKSNLIIKIPATPSTYIRKYHKTMLNKAIKALDNQNFEERDIGGSTFMVEKDRLEEFKEEIKEFRFKMLKKYSTYSEDAVGYQLSTLLFKLEF